VGWQVKLDRRDLLAKCAALGVVSLAGTLTPTVVAAAWDASEEKKLKPTSPCEMGPFYKAGAPSSAVMRAANDRGLPLDVLGVVYNTRGERLQNATVEVWQTDHDGRYDLSGFRYRALLRTNGKGEYQFESVMPGHYPARVCQHIHYLVRAEGHKPLVTQLYFATDPVFEGDPDKNYTRDGLIWSRELVRPVMLKGDPKDVNAVVNFEVVLEGM
jgi:protocatechuate 3,4-dioxygenase beta subunit